MIRTTKPEAGNKYYVRQANGGYSTCIQGSPTDPGCNVLANCVGYACGAFNEELNLGYEKYHLNCNAENFIERAIASGLSVISKPCVGSILCWEGAGSLAGHVGIVIEVIDDNCIRTAESGYGSSTPFWITTRYNNNGRWGLNSNYKVRGFIVNPNYPYNPQPTPTPTYDFNIGDKVIISGNLYVSSNADSPSGYADGQVTNITRIAKGAKHPYNTTGDLGWMNAKDIKKYENPVTPTINPGDMVIVNGSGNAVSNGSSSTWTRSYTNQNMKVIFVNKGAAYPYACNQYGSGTPGNASDVTGWFAAKDVRK